MPTVRACLGLALALALLLAGSGLGPADDGVQAGSTSDAVAAALRWEPLDGPPGGNTTFIAQDPVRPRYLYAAALRGLYRTGDQGESWHLLDPSLTAGASSIAFSEQGAFVCAAGGLLQIAPGSDQPRAVGESCGIVAAQGRFVYTTPPQEVPQGPAVRLYRLESGTTTDEWADVTPPARLWAELEAGLNDEFLHVGIDGLVATPKGLLAVVALERAPGDPENGAAQLLVSDDRGSSWRRADPGFRAPIVLQRLVPQRAGIVVALGHEGHPDPPFHPLAELARISRDGGRSWRALSTVRDIQTPKVGDVDVMGKRVVLTNVDFSILELRGRDRIVSRREMPRVEGYAFNFALSEIVFDVRDRDVMYGRGHLGFEGLIRSRDGGRTWRRLTGGLVAAPAANLTVHPRDPGTFIASGNLGYLPHITRDGGQTWRPLVGTPNMADEVAFDPVDPDHVLMVSELTDVLASRDGGETWRRSAPHFSADRVHDLALTPDGDTLYAANLGSNVSSIDGLRVGDGVPIGLGENWWQNLLYSPDYAYALEVAPDGSVFASYSPKKFEDHAAVWRYRADARDGQEGWSEELRVDGAAGITDLAIGPGDPWRVYAGVTGAQAAIWVSDDRGRSWRPVHEDGFDFVTVHAVAIAPGATDVVYAAPWGAGLFRSQDAGRSWSRMEVPTASVAAIVVDPADAGHVFVGDRLRPTVWETRDAGGSWQRYVDFDDEAHYRVMSLARMKDGIYVSLLDRAPEGLAVFAGRPRSGTTYRVDGEGAHLIEGLPVSALAFTQADDAVYAVGHIGGVYRISAERAVDISTGLPDMGFFDIESIDGRLLVAGGADVDLRLRPRVGDPAIVHNIYEREASGDWVPLLDDDPFRSPVKHLEPGPRPGIIYAGTGTGLWVSSDGGRSWSPQSDGLGVAQVGALDVHQGRIVTGTLGGGVSVGDAADEGGVRWLASGGPHPEIANIRIATHPRDPTRLWASAYPGGVFRSLDGGRTWIESNFGLPSFEVTDPLLQGYYSLALDPTDPRTLYLAIFEHGLFRSTDGAATWRPIGDYGSERKLMRSALTSVVVDRSRPKRLWLASADQGVFMSPDRGRTWQPRNKGLRTREILTLESSPDGTLLAGTAGYGVYRLPPGKRTWQHLGRSVGIGEWKTWDRRLYQYSSLLFDPASPGRVYLGHFPGGFYVSDDGGRSWRSSDLGVGNDGMFSLTAHPEHPERLFAGTYNGILRSDDGGRTWRDASAGMPPEQWPFTVVIDEQEPEVMFTATKNGQNKGFCDRNRETFCGIVMRSTDGGESWEPVMEGLDPLAEYYMVEIDPRDHDVLYLSSSRGVWASADRGDSWVPANGGLEGIGEFFVRDNVAQNLKLTADGRHLLLAVVGYGVWRAALPELGTE